MQIHKAAAIIILLLLLFLAAFNAFAQLPGYIHKGADQNVQQVSVLQLIANPQAYEGRKVRLVGFLDLEFEGDALYLHREDFEHNIDENALWIDVPKEMTKEQMQVVNKQYVICEGIFKASGHGHMGVFSGEIADVTRLQVWPSREDIEKLTDKH
jgi:hypothetical protein